MLGSAMLQEVIMSYHFRGVMDSQFQVTARFFAFHHRLQDYTLLDENSNAYRFATQTHVETADQSGCRTRNTELNLRCTNHYFSAIKERAIRTYKKRSTYFMFDGQKLSKPRCALVHQSFEKVPLPTNSKFESVRL